MAITCERPGTARSRRLTTVSATVPKLRWRVPVRFEIDEQHLAHDRRDRREERRLDIRRQRIRDQREFFRHSLASPVDVLPPVEFHPAIATPTAVADHRDERRAFRADSIGKVTSDSISSGSIPALL